MNWIIGALELFLLIIAIIWGLLGNFAVLIVAVVLLLVLLYISGQITLPNTFKIN